MTLRILGGVGCAAILGLSAAAAQAGSLLESAPAARNWTGFWAGFHVGATHTRHIGEAPSSDCRTFEDASAAVSAEATCMITSETISVQAAAEDDDPATSASATALDIPKSSEGSDLAFGAGDDALAYGATSGDGNGKAASLVFAEAGDALAYAFGYDGFDFGSPSLDVTSFAFGGHLRYDRQVSGHFVFGFELSATHAPKADTSSTVADGLRNEGSAVVNVNISEGKQIISFEGSSFLGLARETTAETDTLASARLRLGYARDGMLTYIVGGIAAADFKASVTDTISFDVFSPSEADVNGTPEAFDFDTMIEERASKSDWVLGGVLGAGVSCWIDDNTVVGVEGLYYRFDEHLNVGGASVELDDVVEVSLKLSRKLR